MILLPVNLDYRRYLLRSRRYFRIIAGIASKVAGISKFSPVTHATPTNHQHTTNKRKPRTRHKKRARGYFKQNLILIKQITCYRYLLPYIQSRSRAYGLVSQYNLRDARVRCRQEQGRFPYCFSFYRSAQGSLVKMFP